MIQSEIKSQPCSCLDKILSPITKCTELKVAVCLELQKIIEALTMPGKGVLACDESPSSLDSRFANINLENTENARRDYREMLLSAGKDELSHYISGVILHPETVYQKTSDDVDFIEFLRRKKIVAGVKLDLGLVPLMGTKDEKTTQGLDNLHNTCMQYKKKGCHFAKWRCVYSISEQCPSQLAMTTNANVLARFCTICQNARIVPIVEAEMLHDNEYTIDRAQQAHEEMLSILFRTLNEHHVYLEGIIMKQAMVLFSEKNKPTDASPQIIAEYTVTTLQRTVPVAVPAVVFLSGGQEDEECMMNLNAISTYETKKPWALTFCFARALQNVALEVWHGQQENVEKAQTIFFEKCKIYSAASLGNLCIQKNQKNTNNECIQNE